MTSAEAIEAHQKPTVLALSIARAFGGDLPAFVAISRRDARGRMRTQIERWRVEAAIAKLRAAHQQERRGGRLLQ